MAGLLPYDDEPLPGGLLSNLQNSLMSPLTLSGMALLSGEGFGGAMRGMQMGSAFDEQRRQRARTAQEQQAYRGLLDNPELQATLPKGFGNMLLAAGPERGFPLFAKYADPDRSLDLEVQRANLAKTKAETSALSQKDAMSGYIMGLLGDGAETGAPATAPFNATPPLLPQSAPMTAAPPQVQNAVSDGMPSLWNVSDVSPKKVGMDNGTVTAERVANPTPPQDAPPAWYRPAQYIPTQAVTPDGPPAASVNGGEDLVQTPFGPMTRDKARKIGGAMLFDPRFAPAGKEFLDASRNVAPGMQKPAVNAIQEKQFNAIEQYSRLKGIESSWKPEYQTIEKRLGFAWNSLVDKLGSARKSLSSQQKQELSAYSASRSEALNNLNQYIKEITGAAMTIPEANRMKKTQPNPGEGIFDGDSPIEFQSKMDTNIRTTKMALARYSYLSKRGFPDDVDAMAREISLDDMPKVIQNRTNELLKESLDQNPGMNKQDVLPIVRQRLRAEFGVDA